MASDVQEAARRYIDRVIAINRHHGMGGRLSKEEYDRAVEAVVRTAGGLMGGSPRTALPSS